MFSGRIFFTSFSCACLYWQNRPADNWYSTQLPKVRHSNNIEAVVLRCRPNAKCICSIATGIVRRVLQVTPNNCIHTTSILDAYLYSSRVRECIQVNNCKCRDYDAGCRAARAAVQWEKDTPAACAACRDRMRCDLLHACIQPSVCGFKNAFAVCCRSSSVLFVCVGMQISRVTIIVVLCLCGCVLCVVGGGRGVVRRPSSQLMTCTSARALLWRSATLQRGSGWLRRRTIDL